jgi:hypothetical protein
VTLRGLLPLSTSVHRLNGRKFNSAIKMNLQHSFCESIDPAEPNQRSYAIQVGPWQFIALFESSRPHSQLSIEIDVRLGMGDLFLARQLSLHGFFGIGGTSWDLARPGEEETLGVLASEGILRVHASKTVSCDQRSGPRNPLR